MTTTSKIPRIFATILIGILLIVLAQQAFSTKTQTGNYYLDTPLPIASFYVGQYTNGTYYAINGSNWHNFLRSTNASLVINTCLSSLTTGRTWQEKVLLVGSFTIDSPLIVYSFTILELDGKVTLADGSDCNMIENGNRNTNNVAVTIQGGEWDNNSAGQTAGTSNIIDWYHTTQPTGYYMKRNTFRDMHMSNVEDDAIHLNGSVSAFGIFVIEYIGIKGIGTYGIWARYLADSFIRNCVPLDGTTRGLYLESASCIILSDNYINKGIIIKTSNNIVCTNTFIDIGSDYDGMILQGVRRSVFSNLDIRAIGDSSATISGISLETSGSTHSCNNTFSSIWIGRTFTSYTRQWTYGIEETDANQNFNAYCAIVGIDSKTATLLLNGVNSTYAGIVGIVA